MATVNSDIFLSNSNITSIKLGNTSISKVFLGNSIVFETIESCPDSTSSVKMTGWFVGDRTLSPIGYAPYGRETYIYGDEAVRYETGVWIYTNTGGEIVRAYSYADWPWLVDWPSPYAAEKVRQDGTSCGSPVSTPTPTPTPSPTPPSFGSSGFQWMTMNSITESTASGIGQNNITIDITQTGGGMFSHANGAVGTTNFPIEYGVPTSGNQIGNTQAGVFTAVFSSPVTDALVAFASVGQQGTPVPVEISSPFTPIWGTSTTYQNPVNATQYSQFTGEEGYNIIRIDGTVTTVTFNYTVSENYCTVCFGFVDQNTITPTPTATPTTTQSVTPTNTATPTPTPTPPVTVGTQGFGTLGTTIIDTDNITTATVFTLNDVRSTASQSGYFVGLPTNSNIGNWSFDTNVGTSLSFTNVALGTFQSTTITTMSITETPGRQRTFSIFGSFTGGTNRGNTTPNPTTANITLTLTQSGAAISSSAILSIPVLVPGPVTILTANPGSDEISITWAAPDNGGSPILDYSISVRTPGSFSIRLVSRSLTSFTIPNLLGNREYTIAMAARNAVGTGPWGPDIVVTTTASATPTPTPTATPTPTPTTPASINPLSLANGFLSALRADTISDSEFSNAALVNGYLSVLRVNDTISEAEFPNAALGNGYLSVLHIDLLVSTSTLTSGGGNNSWRWQADGYVTAGIDDNSQFIVGKVDGTVLANAGWRTTGLGVKPSTIVSATFTAPTYRRDGSAFNIVIRGASLDNAGTLLTGTNLTTAQVTVSAPSAGTNLSVDVTAIVREITGRAGWGAGNAIVLYLLDANAGSDNNWRMSADTGGSLVINYT
jgi:hypothetical protein